MYEEATPLRNSGTVAQLTAHAEALTRAGVFKGEPLAASIFAYLCRHPSMQINHNKYPDANGFVVESVAAQAKEIAANTGIALQTVYKKLDVLRALKLIRGGPGGDGPLAVASMNRKTEGFRRTELLSPTENKSEQLIDSPTEEIPLPQRIKRVRTVVRLNSSGTVKPPPHKGSDIHLETYDNVGAGPQGCTLWTDDLVRTLIEDLPGPANV